MARAQTAVQLYTLRNVDEPFTTILERVADAGFDGVEFAYRVTESDPDDVAATLEETGLEVAGAHVGIDALEDDFEETVAFYRALGCTDIVIPWLDAEHFQSRAAVADAVDRLESIEEDLADHDLALHYHNHHHEYVDLDGETGFDAFVDASEFGIELDLGLALLGGDDPAARLESLGGRASLTHVKDVDPEKGESVPLGDGALDLAACTEAFDAVGGEWLIYEYEGESPLESLEAAAEALSQ